MNILNKSNHSLRRSARLLATQASQGIIDVVGEPLDGSCGIQTSKRANNDTSVAINHLRSEPDLLALKKRKILGKEHVDPDHENARPSKRTRRPEPVYIIPDVEKKKTAFRGRLGLHLQLRPLFHFSYFIRRLCMPKYRHAK
jgi:hypothetical protein